MIRIQAIPAREQWRYPLGKNLFDINWSKFRGDIVDLIGSVDEQATTQIRIVGFWNPVTKCYHWYATNLRVKAELVYPLYRIRWQLELWFKAAKTSLCLADTPSANPNIIINLVYASVIANLIAQPLANAGLSKATNDIRLAKSLQRAAMVFVHLSGDLLNFLIHGSKEAANLLCEKITLFLPELIDPNYKRRPTTLKLLEGLT